MAHTLKEELLARLRQAGAFDARVADPRKGFEHALPGMHPLAVWPEMRSIVVFAVATPPEGNNTYLGAYAPWQGDRRLGPVPADIQAEDYGLDRLCRLLIASVTLRGIGALMERGHGVRFWPSTRFQLKLCAAEAGLGVYGRSGQIIHPVLRNRIRLGAFATDAFLEGDGRLTEFGPCAGCDRCIRACPAGALDPDAPYPASFAREKCIATRARIAERGRYCHNCYAACPAGAISDDRLLSIRRSTTFYQPEAASKAAG
jgi:epoxyqueuosine reductase QueG